MCHLSSISFLGVFFNVQLQLLLEVTITALAHRADLVSKSLYPSACVFVCATFLSVFIKCLCYHIYKWSKSKKSIAKRLLREHFRKYIDINCFVTLAEKNPCKGFFSSFWSLPLLEGSRSKSAAESYCA